MKRTYFDIFIQGVVSLQAAAIETPSVEAQWLFCACFECSKAQFLARFKDPAPYKETQLYFRLIQKRCTGKPLAYILKQVEFRKHTYHVTSGVLIPRPETELLVDTALALIRKNKWEENVTIIEFGYGSGIVGIELALELPNSSVYGWDKGKTPYRIATENAKMLKAENIQWTCANFFHQKLAWDSLLLRHPAVFVANPPYIPNKDISALDPTVKNFEPQLALKGGKNGMSLYNRLIPLLLPYKIPMVFELGIYQEPHFRTLFKALGISSKRVSFISDWNHIPRVLTLLP